MSVSVNSVLLQGGVVWEGIHLEQAINGVSWTGDNMYILPFYDMECTYACITQNMKATLLVAVIEPWQKQFKEGRVYLGSQYEGIRHGVCGGECEAAGHIVSYSVNRKMNASAHVVTCFHFYLVKTLSHGITLPKFSMDFPSVKHLWKHLHSVHPEVYS